MLHMRLSPRGAVLAYALLAALLLTLLPWIGHIAPALAQEDDGEAEPADQNAGEDQSQDDDLEAIWELYKPPVPLETTNEVGVYELFRQPGGELAATLYVPHWVDLDEREDFPALDLKAFIGATSKLDPSFEPLAHELASWQFQPDMTAKASFQLMVLHLTCANGEAEGMPKMTTMGDATSLDGDLYEVIILHPSNVPIAGAQVIPVKDGDSFGIMLLSAGALSAPGFLVYQPAEEPGDNAGGEDEIDDYFTILPEFQPPTELQTIPAVDVYEVNRQLDGEAIATAIIPNWHSIEDVQGFPALDLCHLLNYCCERDQSYWDLQAAMLRRKRPAQLPNLASWQLMLIHAFCRYPEDEQAMPALEPFGDSTLLAGDQRACIILHPHNVPIAGALMCPDHNGDDFGNLLTVIGEFMYAP